MNFHLDASGVLRVEAWRDLPWLQHGFTTRRAGDFRNTVPDAEALGKLGADRMQLRTVRQIHSSRVWHFSDEDEPWDPSRRPEADAGVTSRPDFLLAVRTADCLPVLLVDRSRRAVAAVHAGWRGTEQRIVGRAVERMRACFGSEPAALEAAIGPGIASCCFEVGPEVAERFDPSLVIPAPRDAAREAPQQAPRPHVDLVEANRRQLLQQGIPNGQIWSAGHCTCCRPDDFFSYRRDGDQRRMLAFIGIEAPK
jgi:YfiH family protein